MSNEYSKCRMHRRTVLRGLLLLPTLAIAGRVNAADNELQRLSESNTTAKVLGYHHDAEAIDSEQFPERGGDEFCHNCRFVEGIPGEQWRPCQIFPKHLVNADGWCKSWSEASSS